jgi:UPF0755 protein
LLAQTLAAAPTISMLKKLLVTALLAALAFAAALGFWVTKPIGLASETLELQLESGTSAKAVAQAVVQAGAQVNPTLLYAWFRLSGKSRQIKAGSYEFEAGVTPWQLLDDLSAGRESLRRLTLVEGWTFKQVRQALAKHEMLRHDTAALSDAQIMQALGRPGVHPEGRFFPDTYSFAKNSSELHVLQRAMLSMDKRLQNAWAQRSADTPLTSPDQALILASIVEKETGKPSDRGQIAGVFVNRLRMGMLLQTDPTVIYGMGDNYDGRIRKRDLQTDTPYNTYTRAGLPPTPIAMPSWAALQAATNPQSTQALYFVARGDGSSQFSETLLEHNRAVNQYIRGQK